MKDIKGGLIGEELRKRLIEKGIDPSTIVNIITENDKYKRRVVIKVICEDGGKYELVDDFVVYAARKNKRW